MLLILSLRSEAKSKVLAELAFQEPDAEGIPIDVATVKSRFEKRNRYVASEAIKRLENFDLKANPKYQVAVERILKNSGETATLVSLVDRFNLKEQYPKLLSIAIKHSDKQLGVDAVRVLLKKKQRELIQKAILKTEKTLEDERANRKIQEDAIRLIRAIGLSEGKGYHGILVSTYQDDSLPMNVRRAAMVWASKTSSGVWGLASMAKNNKVPDGLDQTAASILHSFPMRYSKEIAEKVYPLPPTKDAKPLPSVVVLAKRIGDMPKGRLLFHNAATCAKCHTVNGLGREIGPDLSEIGKKLSKQAMYESILFPSAAISHGYESYLIVTTKGKSYTGLKTSETAERVTLKNAEGILRTIPKGKILKIEKQKVSMMPSEVQKLLTEEDLVDLVEYLTTLKAKKQ